ncbi:MAG: hypothetical protein DRN64_00820 [Thaumarchaeota archaeon]|nr:MAG: hypothetical protein DRN64_00820 [Nitrososphaerota archaeon]HDD66370.1 hypothetical protein [Nitrososphaeria archaeon]
MVSWRRRGISSTALGIIALIILFVIFIVVRELWQKGGKPLAEIPGVSYYAIALLVVFGVIIYLVHKKTSGAGT